MKVIQRTLLGLALATASVLPAAAADTKIRLGLSPTPETATAFIARDRGFFKKHGLDVDLVIVPVNGTLPAAIMSNSIEVASITPTIMLSAVENGVEMKAFANVSLTSKTGSNFGLLVPPGSTIATAKDLEGKKIATPAVGGVVDTLSRRWLQANGADLKKVIFVELPFPAQPDALKAGQVDAVITSDPFLSRVTSGGIGRQIVDLRTTAPEGVPTTVYASSKDWAAANGPAIAAFREAIGDAIAFMKTDEPAVREDLTRDLKLPPEVMKTVTLPNVAVKLVPADIDWWSDAMVKLGMLSKPIPASLLIVP